MGALLKHYETKALLPVRATGRKADVREMYERVMKRYPKTMARLAE